MLMVKRHNDEIESLREKIKSLEAALVKKDKINQVLMSRVEKSVDSAGDAYMIFENNILLQQQIEERQKVEDALRESEQRLQTILDSIQTGVMIVDSTNHVIVDANPVAGKMIGLPKEKIMGRKCHGFICPNEENNCPITVLGKEVDKTERVLVNASGKKVPILKTVSPIILDGRKHLIETFQDISERKRAEEEIRKHKDHLEELVAERTEELTAANIDLKREITERKEAVRAMKEAKDEAEAANKAKSQFLAKMSHEIRTPLNGIIGFSEIVLRSDSLEKCHNHGRIILEESEHLLSLINEILDHAKIESGKIDLEYRPIDLRSLIELIVSSNHVLAKKKGLELKTIIDDRISCYVMCDSLRLRQILLNLVGNAIKFTDIGSVTIKVEALNTDDKALTIQFSVIDTGIGIAKEKQSSIFERFVQVAEGNTRKYGGTGLGITIAKQLVSLMGGQMGVKSQPDKGSTFWFSLLMEKSGPIQPSESDAKAIGKASSCVELDQHRIGHILVAEDYPVNQVVVRQHLEEAGYEVTIVEDGEEAVSVCETNSYDLILMDIQMPNMDGYEATQRIRTSSSPCANVPILALTANADAQTRDGCIQAKMNDVLTKPIRRKALLSGVDQWIRPVDKIPIKSSESSNDVNDNDSPGNNTPINYNIAIEEFDDLGIVEELVTQFIEKVEIQIVDMKEALSTENMERLRREAHALKGGAGTLVAKPLAEVAAQMEKICKSNDVKQVPGALNKVKTELQRLKTYVEGHARP